MTLLNKTVPLHVWPLACILLMASFCALQATPQDFDHSAFDRLLAQAVVNGRVDYAAFRTSREFAAYLVALERAAPATLPAAGQLAFWINAYNSLTIRNVLDNPGIKQPTDIKGFFDIRKFKVAGQQLSLNDIENTIIRARFKDPLIHFGLVCAARSCPPLLPRAYTGSTVYTLLAQNATAYLASQYNRYDIKDNVLRLSKIFEWYAADFNGEAGTRDFVRKYGTVQMKQALAASPAVTVAFLEYDWTLNAR